VKLEPEQYHKILCEVGVEVATVLHTFFQPNLVRGVQAGIKQFRVEHPDCDIEDEKIEALLMREILRNLAKHNQDAFDGWDDRLFALANPREPMT
jgi:hypothetical protein